MDNGKYDYKSQLWIIPRELDSIQGPFYYYYM